MWGTGIMEYENGLFREVMDLSHRKIIRIGYPGFPRHLVTCNRSVHMSLIHQIWLKSRCLKDIPFSCKKTSYGQKWKTSLEFPTLWGAECFELRLCQKKETLCAIGFDMTVYETWFHFHWFYHIMDSKKVFKACGASALCLLHFWLFTALLADIQINLNLKIRLKFCFNSIFSYKLTFSTCLFCNSLSP